MNHHSLGRPGVCSLGSSRRKGANILRPRSSRDYKSIEWKRWREQACARVGVRYRHLFCEFMILSTRSALLQHNSHSTTSPHSCLCTLADTASKMCCRGALTVLQEQWAEAIVWIMMPVSVAHFKDLLLQVLQASGQSESCTGKGKGVIQTWMANLMLSWITMTPGHSWIRVDMLGDWDRHWQASLRPWLP